jgi:hypothetical protein
MEMLFRTMAHWQLGKRDAARADYEEFMAWRKKAGEQIGDEIVQLQEEVAALIGTARPERGTP